MTADTAGRKSPVAGTTGPSGGPADERFARELDAMAPMQPPGASRDRDIELERQLGEIIDVAIAVAGADFGNVQLLDPVNGDLRIVAQRGFPQWWLDFWASVTKGQGSCGTALERGERVIVEDVEQSPIFMATPAMEIQRRAGVRAVQSTPLMAKSGSFLGVFSTHCTKQGGPDPRQLLVLDLLARHTADVVEHARGIKPPGRAGIGFVAEDVKVRRHAEAELQRTKVLLETLLTTAPIGFGYFDCNLRFVMINDRLAQINGLPIAAHLGRTISDILPTLAPTARDVTDRILATGEPVIGHEFCGETPRVPGVIRQWSESWFPVRDPEGAIAGFGVIVEEITERKRAAEALARSTAALRESEERYRALVSMLTDVPWTSNAAGELLEPQPAFEAFTGTTAAQNRGLGWANALHPDDRERVAGLWQRACETRTGYESSGRIWHAASQSYHYYKGRATPILNVDGSIKEWVGALTDVHEQTLAEQALRDADRRKDEFLATLGHELRNPLAPIANALEIMRMAANDEAVQRRAHELIERQLAHMVRLIDDLLDMSRIGRGKLELRLEDVELAAVIESAMETTQPFVELGGHVTSVDLPAQPIRLRGDPVRLAQVFGNLLTNACKFTPKGGRIAIAAHVQDGNAIVSVTDNRLGIPSDKLGSIFEMFTQLDMPLSQGQGGLGIGLALTRQLVELHGGRIEATSDGPGHGSEFVVTLPMASRRSAAEGADRAQ
ncbi:MAG: ATP-binding protein [Burkholderiales bacterium]